MLSEKVKQAVLEAGLSSDEKNSAFRFGIVHKTHNEDSVFPSIYKAREYIDSITDEFSIFRGQTNNWPVVSSLWRKKGKEKEKVFNETVKFMEWVLNNPSLKEYCRPQDKIVAIAQHHSYEHQLATHLLDFSYSLDVASFFATDGVEDIASIGVIIVANIPTMKLCYSYMGIEGVSMVELEGLWRLENQEGIFLKDINGDFDKFSPIVKIKFKQKEKFISEKINREYIYPQENMLEHEINRYFSIALRSRPIEEIADGFEVLKVEKNPVQIEATQVIRHIDWGDTKKWQPSKIKKYSNLVYGQGSCVFDINENGFALTKSEHTQAMTILSTIKMNSTAPIIPNIKLNSSINDVTDLSIDRVQIIFNKYLSEFCKTYVHLPFSDYQFSVSLKMLALCAIYESDQTPDIVGGHPGLQTFCRIFESGNMFYCEIEDVQGVVSHSYILKDFLHHLTSLDDTRKLFNEHFKGRSDFCDLSGKSLPTHLEYNFQLFQFVSNIRQLISLDDFLNIFALFVIPWKIAFRNNQHVISNPLHVKEIGLA